MVNLEWYRSFLEVYRAGTVSAAANDLNLTQPAVSQHIFALESAVGAQLFKRLPRKMLPTERGKELYTEIVEAVERLESVTQNIRSSNSQDKPLLKIGAPVEYFSTKLVEKLKNANFRVWLDFDLAQNLIEKLKTGDLDIGIFVKKFTHSEIEFKQIDTEKFILICSSEMTIPALDWKIDKAEIEDWLRFQNWISYSVELPIIRRFWQTHFGKRLTIKPDFVIPNLQTILKAIEMNLGISILPEYLCRESLSIGKTKILFDLPEKVNNEIWIAYNRRDQKNNLIGEFSSLLTN